MRVLVLGGYGLIGTHVVQRLLEAGHDVVGLGRDVGQAAIKHPEVEWVAVDIASLHSAAMWAPLLERARADAIVNCAGALQDGARDSVGDVQSVAMRALYVAAGTCALKSFVQISAPRASLLSATTFMRTKGEADAALQSSALDWVILRPGLVFAAQAYGGTALLRALAAFPWVQPMAYGDSLLQTVSAEDVAEAVLAAMEGRVARRRAYDLVEDQAHSLREIVRQLRAWHGLAPVPEVNVPLPIVNCVARVADGLGWLGWRSPLRTTAITELAAGVVGDPTPWHAQIGHSLSPVQTTLRRMPATVQERWFARSFFMKPAVIAVLAAFWIVTGVVTLADPTTAARVLTGRGFSDATALVCVSGGAVVDVMLGLAVVRRASMVSAAKGMIAVTLLYLVTATMLAPDLWLDPLGPLVKAVPAMMLALVLLAWEGDR